ncbi:MAG: hypothetical protein AB7G23_10100 [Vicinamibacterales bacterium]
MRLLFSVNNFGFLRNFEPALRLLAARGHQLHLVAERKDSVGGMRTIENLVAEHPDRITHGFAPKRKDDPWQAFAVQTRLCLDYWRYLEPRYDQAPSLRARAARQAPPLAAALPSWPLVGTRAGMRAVSALLDRAERLVPPGDTVERFLRDQRPDLILLTPLIYFGSTQVEYVRAARALGLRTVLGVGSWDHLTTKGLIHEMPDRVLVWNEMQKREAAELHGVSPDRVTVTGAQAYDHWFAQQPSSTREAFCAKVGIPADRAVLLYLCSSPFITPYEVGFVRSWIAAIRAASDPVLRRAAILIRPHPQNAAQWADFDATALDAVGIWPRAGANPVDRDARADYYDSMFHSHAVVGVNTSALIESGIVGRPVYTVLTTEFAGQQEGTLHFQHLKNVNGGLLTVAASLDEHVAQLAVAVAQPPDAARSRAFVGAFVRPYGLDVPAATHFADAIEAEAAAPRPAPARPSPGTRLGRTLLAPAASAARVAVKRRASRRAAEDGDAAPPRTQRILFALSSPEYLRYYDSTMRLLADQGHDVAVAVNWLRERKAARLDELVDPRIRVAGLVPKRSDLWTPLARGVRGTMDFARYLHPRFAEAPALRARMYRKVLPPLMRPLDRLRSLSEASLERLLGVFRALERAIPVSRRLRAFLDAETPDVVIVSPLVDAASDQVDLVRAAKAEGIPVAAAIASWDNLTNKGLLRVEPDLVVVWNERQKEEAVTLQGVPPARVAVTGAQLFDRWFDREPSQARDAFCRMVGLPDDRPFILFTGSSVFIARSELEEPFVREWVTALRQSGDPLLRDAAVLVRPHPFNCDAWTASDMSDIGPVAVWPRQRYTPAAEEARTSFYDSLHFSAAVVGINTSAMIEAAIVGRPVLSVTAPQFAGTQEGTLHFHHLLPENGGFLRMASSIEAHVPQLAEVLHDPDASRQQTARFVASFIRPHGLDRPATPILARTFEDLARTGRHAPARESMATKLLRVVVWPLALVVKWASLGADARPMARKALYETWFTLGRTTRLVIKRAVIRPVREVRRGLVLLLRSLRKAAVFVLRWTVVRPVKYALRGVRLLRYHVAVKLRGGSLGTGEADGPR